MVTKKELEEVQTEAGRLLGILQKIARDSALALSKQDPIACRKCLEDVESTSRAAVRGASHGK